MLDAIRQAFAKAGLPASAVSFAAACHDAARMALNVTNGDPKKAVAVWLNTAGGPSFRPLLEQFLAAVAEERRDPKSDGAGHAPCAEKGHSAGARPSEPNAAEAIDAVSQDRARDAKAAPDAAAGASVLVPQGRSQPAPVAAPKPPAAATVRGIVHAKEMSARVMSGIYLTERQGSRVLLDDIPVSSIDTRLRHMGRRAANSAVDYNTLLLVKEHVGRQAFVPDRAVVGDVADADTLRQLNNLARAFASSPMVQLPEALRQEVMAA